jgi:uncharacterized protein (TIGR02246 family)
MTAAEVRDLFDRYAAAWEARDPDAIAALHTEESVFHLHSGSDPAEGREAVRATFAEMFAQWPDLSFDLVDLLVSEEGWAVEWKIRAGDLEADLADVVRVEDGLVSSKQSYIDGVAVQAALESAAAGAGAAA